MDDRMATLPAPGTRIIEETDKQLEKPLALVLLDDDHHTYQYVIAMLAAVFHYGTEKGFAIACVVDSQGQAILMTGSRDEVELKQQLVHAFGPDPLMENCAGSMTAVIEQLD
jgi:ATP-dependent Clp protease adaptor protein ClpS